jgi:hypothetical protein
MFAYCVRISSENKHYTTQGNFVEIGSHLALYLSVSMFHTCSLEILGSQRGIAEESVYEVHDQSCVHVVSGHVLSSVQKLQVFRNWMFPFIG